MGDKETPRRRRKRPPYTVMQQELDDREIATVVSDEVLTMT